MHIRLQRKQNSFSNSGEGYFCDKIPNYEYLNDRYIDLNPAVPGKGMEQIPATYPSQCFPFQNMNA